MPGGRLGLKVTITAWGSKPKGSRERKPGPPRRGGANGTEHLPLAACSLGPGPTVRSPRALTTVLLCASARSPNHGSWAFVLCVLLVRELRLVT